MWPDSEKARLSLFVSFQNPPASPAAPELAQEWTGSGGSAPWSPCVGGKDVATSEAHADSPRETKIHWDLWGFQAQGGTGPQFFLQPEAPTRTHWGAPGGPAHGLESREKTGGRGERLQVESKGH